MKITINDTLYKMSIEVETSPEFWYRVEAQAFIGKSPLGPYRLAQGKTLEEAIQSLVSSILHEEQKP